MGGQLPVTGIFWRISCSNRPSRPKPEAEFGIASRRSSQERQHVCRVAALPPFRTQSIRVRHTSSSTTNSRRFGAPMETYDVDQDGKQTASLQGANDEPAFDADQYDATLISFERRTKPRVERRETPSSSDLGDVLGRLSLPSESSRTRKGPMRRTTPGGDELARILDRRDSTSSRKQSGESQTLLKQPEKHEDEHWRPHSQISKDSNTSSDVDDDAHVNLISAMTRKDDGRIFRSYMVLDQRFDVSAKYLVQDVLGQGAYGMVAAAYDKENQIQVAIKRMDRPFQHVELARRTVREIRLLRLLKHENLIGVQELMKPPHLDAFDALYSVHELMEMDLHGLIQSSQTLGDEHVQFFVYQVLRGVKYMHTANVVHRDIKPRNLLINSSCDLKICDFGLAKFVGDGDTSNSEEHLTDYVATRWYRAPEVVMKWRRSNLKALDMWSIGCVLAELVRREPLFAGSDMKDQLDVITQQLGSLPSHEMELVEDDDIRVFLEGLGHRDSQDLAPRLSGASPQALDMVERLVTLYPDKRMDVVQALEHSYLESLHDPMDEPCGPEVQASAFEFDTRASSIESLRVEVLREIAHYHAPHLQT